jgi:hypothetical protein
VDKDQAKRDAQALFDVSIYWIPMIIVTYGVACGRLLSVFILTL